MPFSKFGWGYQYLKKKYVYIICDVKFNEITKQYIVYLQRAILWRTFVHGYHDRPQIRKQAAELVIVSEKKIRPECRPEVGKWD